MDSQLKKILLTDLKLPEAAIEAHANFEEAGMDSLAIVELSLLLSERLGVNATEDELLDAKTIGGIETLVAERRGMSCQHSTPSGGRQA
ncbi:acyl carrier protein [Streptomyces sp. VB1]|uniref:acyl carrier protein n=1 Tax=Streptomyces sp. VB1 TaxID=2986803 RepID=UPI0022421260|nr:acyl carrier protein [Streptomyces sp. VB1]UZI32376.1 acyl carrier protein [Streptomyces sp. VB1]